MPRAIWSGAISFGLVSVPVKLYSAVSPKTVRFHQLHAADGVRIQQKRFCPADGQEVPYDEIVKGYEIAPDRYVVIEPEELEALQPEKTRTIDIEDFVELEQIDPIFYDHPYYLAPGPAGAKPYRLLLEAMNAEDKVGIARVVIRSKEQLVALRPMGDVIGMATMVFADEVIDPHTLEELADGEVKTTPRELEVARQLVDSLASPFEPEKYKDTYREQVLDLIDRKAAGEEITLQPPAEEPSAPTPDLMSALQASLEEVRRRSADGDGEAKPKPKRSRKAASSASGGSSGSSGSSSGRKRASSGGRSTSKR